MFWAFSGVSFSTLSKSYVRAENVNLEAKSKAQLSQEEQSNTEILKLSGSASGVKVVFEDSQSQKLISLNLSDENFTRLQEKFTSENDYFTRRDGSIRLNGEAGNFISSWFNDMAYNLNWLNADSNKDGLIKGAELGSALLHSSAVKVGFNEISFSYLGKINASSSQLDEINIEEGLNERLMSDENLDGNVTFGELYDEASLNSFAKTAQEGGNATTLKKKNEEEDLLQKALSKGINSLNANELAEFKRKYPSQYERLGGSNNDLTTNFKEDFLKQLRGLDFQILNIKA